LESATVEKDKKGNPIVVYKYPALEDLNNWKDIMLVSVLAEKVSFMQDFGQVCEAWKDTVEFLRLQLINGDKLIYEKGISVDTVKGCWKQYIAVVKRYKARVLASTGTDNEVTPPLLFELEDIYDKSQTHQTSAMNAKNNKAAKKHRDMEACDKLREAGTGNLAAANEDLVEENTNDTNGVQPSARKKQCRSFVAGSTAMVEKREELMIEREKTKQLAKILQEKNKEKYLEEKKLARVAKAKEKAEEKAEKKRERQEKMKLWKEE
jgi:hypothetical protein